MMCMTIRAQVLAVEQCRLWVRDTLTGQTLVVNSPQACRFQPGQTVTIRYSGAMTMSIPPQLTACSIMIRV